MHKYSVSSEIHTSYHFCRFYYADERQSDGGPTIPVNGPAAGRAYVELARDKTQRPPLYTFVDGKGYMNFLKS